MRINKHDTNGTKPLLGKGELGYDDYSAGGDTGRVYVGTGTENIALAERLESNMMTKAQFNALAEERKANRAGSGFDEWGKHSSSAAVTPINNGMHVWSGASNFFFMGEYNSTLGVSKTLNPYSCINGILSKISSINASGSNIINLPTAPNIYPYDTVLTSEQIASGVIKHADASNSGLIVNGKFDTDTSGWAAQDSNIVVQSGKLKILTTNIAGGALQIIPTIIGKKYIIEGISENITSTDSRIRILPTDSFTTIADSNINTSNASLALRVEFIATTTSVRVYLRASGSSKEATFDNIAVYPEDAISRSDLVFLESWHEDISEKNFVYPLGNVQYLGGNTDGLTGIINGAFTGFETYSLFGNWQTPSALIGKGYVWSSLTEAQRKAFIANPENNCYLDGDKTIQVRYRVRVVQGISDEGININPYNNYFNVIIGSYTNYIKPKGQKISLGSEYGNADSIGIYGHGISTWVASLPYSSQSGIFSASNALGSTTGFTAGSYNGQCFALPIALVHRKNQGMYHPVYNPNGTKKASDNKFWYETVVTFTSISDCFNPDKLLTASGYIGSVSGRPDGLFYDQVHESDIIDLRNSSKKVEDYNRLINREFNKLVAGTTRGKEGEKLFKPITFTNCGFIQYGSPVGTKQSYRLSTNSSFMPKWHSYWGSSVYSNINQLFGGVVPTIPFAIILAKKDGTNYFIEVSPLSSFVDLVVFRTLDGTPTLPNVGSLVELVFDEITWLWLPSAYEYMGTSYRHKNSVISNRTKSNTLLHCDIIGNPTNYPTSWKQSGVFGTPLIVAEDGTSLLPDGVKDTFKLSRKANATPLLCLRSTDSGVTWTSFTPTFSTVTNEITLTDEPANNLVMVYYQTKTIMAVPTVNSEVLCFNTAWFTSSTYIDIGNILLYTCIGKVGTVTTHNSRGNSNVLSYNIYANKFDTTTSYAPSHIAFSPAVGNSPAVKVFPYLTRTNGKAYLNLVFKEMKHNGTSWGDSNTFNIVDNVSTTVDNNGATILIGQKEVELPYFIDAGE